MIKVKICGIQQPADALVAAEAGADFVGIVFVPERHRRLDTGAARGIVQALRSSSELRSSHAVPKIAGLFADQPIEDVNSIIGACQLDMAQLCGKEPLEYCGKVDAQVIKVVHVDVSETGAATAARLAERVKAYCDAGHLVTLDRLVAGIQGGTGQSFDWDIAAQLSRRGLSFLLAGGLSPDNVARAVAEVQPWGVDVSSGVESGGVKDHEKIRAFVEKARTTKSWPLIAES